MKRIVIGLVSILVAAATAPVRAGEQGGGWQQWRGPYFNGASDATDLPAKLDEKSNLRWAIPLPGPSAATPVVSADRVFVSSLDNTSKKLLAMCLSRSDGTILWSKQVGEGFVQNRRNNLASPSPLTDGKHVWFTYGNGDLIAFDLAGKQQWARNLAKEHGPFHYNWIYGSTPLLYDGRLYVQVLHRDRPIGNDSEPKMPAASYLLAIDPNTGKDIWKHDRPNDAVQESKEAYSTPVPLEYGGRKLVVLIGGDVVTAHDAASGEEIWRCGGWNPQKIEHWRLVPSVVIAANLVIASPPKGGAVFAIKPDGKGDVSQTHVAWKNPELSTDVCAPLLYKDKLYVLDGDGPKTLSRADPATGKVESKVTLGGRDVFRASPTAADDKIYCMNEAGQVWIISTAGDKLEIINNVDLGGDIDAASRSTIALADGQVFVRTADKIQCFGAK